MAKSADVFPNADNPDVKVKEVQAWLKAKGVRNFEPVSLFSVQLKKVLKWPCLTAIMTNTSVPVGNRQGDRGIC